MHQQRFKHPLDQYRKFFLRGVQDLDLLGRQEKMPFMKPFTLPGGMTGIRVWISRTNSFGCSMTYLLAAGQCVARLSSSALSESKVALTLSPWIL
jgi:hypothetical protein